MAKQNKDDCFFCRLYQMKTAIFYENEHFFSRFDWFPVSPGHSEVIPKKHVYSLLHLAKDEWASLQDALSKTVTAIEKTDLSAFYTKFLENPLYGGYLTPPSTEKSLEFCGKMLNHIGIGKKPQAYNYGVNDGPAAGRTVPHLHIHVIPRFIGDVEDPTGGVRCIIPGMGNYKK